ncbi:MAG: protease inhibitor I9 family protein, partial [Micromonosporaceae bacterium]
MRRTLLALTASIPLTVALALPASAAGGEYVQITQATGEKVAGQYIVTLKDDAGVSTTAAGIDATPLHTYRSALNGFAAKLSATQLQDLQRNPQVAAIEEDG